MVVPCRQPCSWSLTEPSILLSHAYPMFGRVASANHHTIPLAQPPQSFDCGLPVARLCLSVLCSYQRMTRYLEEGENAPTQPTSKVQSRVIVDRYDGGSLAMERRGKQPCQSMSIIVWYAIGTLKS